MFLKGKIAFFKIATKALLKPHSELVALVILRVPHVLTVPLLNFYLTKKLLRDGGVCSSVGLTGGLGFLGGSLGWVRSKLALTWLSAGLLCHNLVLAVRTPISASA